MDALIIILGILWDVFSLLCVLFTVTAFCGGFSKAVEKIKEEQEYEDVPDVPEPVPDLLKGFVKQVYVENHGDRYMMYEFGSNAYIEQGKTYNDLRERAEGRFPDTTFILTEEEEQVG